MLVLAMIFGGVGGYFLINILLNEIYATHIEVGLFNYSFMWFFYFYNRNYDHQRDNIQGRCCKSGNYFVRRIIYNTTLNNIG